MLIRKFVFLIIGLTALFSMAVAEERPADCPGWLNHDIKKLHSKTSVNLCNVVAGKTLLLVNTASHCGYTSQFGGLEKLYQQYKERGLVVIGFPSDDFNQEADTPEETATVCYKNYGVTFLMSEEVGVKGDSAHPIFKHLSQQQGTPTWNFNKYLVDKQGNVVTRFSSQIKPGGRELTASIEGLL